MGGKCVSNNNNNNSNSTTATAAGANGTATTVAATTATASPLLAMIAPDPLHYKVVLGQQAKR
eukprot:1924-Heterococcus_DN1.PRE.1